MTKEITNKGLSTMIEDLAVMMKEGFDDIHERFATKDDLKRFATKDDLKRFATKDDLNRKIDKVLVKEDYTAQLIKEVRTELVASTGARLRQEDKIDKNKEALNNHETRIKKLELSSV